MTRATLAITTFNVLSLVGAECEKEILTALHRSSIIGLQGTCLRSSLTTQVGVVFNYNVVGFPTTASGPKSAVKVCVHKKFGTIRRIFEPTQQLKGRAGAIWVQFGTHSVCAFSLYFRPDPMSKISRTTAIQICDWVDGVLSQLPARCTPVVTMYLNDDGDATTLPSVFGPLPRAPTKIQLRHCRQHPY